MRRRATFILQDQQDNFQPSDIQIKGRQLLHPGLKASREEKLTFGFSELPAEIANVLKQSHELHIRWVSSLPYNASEPFVSSAIPGLHVHLIPEDQNNNGSLCQSLRGVFAAELDCRSIQTSFTQPLVVSQRYSSSGALQYHTNLSNLVQLVAYLQKKICTPSDLMCLHRASLLNAADYLDIDYDSISHALTLTAFWSKPLANYYDPIGEMVFEDQWPLDISSARTDKVEVGILKSSKATDVHDLQLEGFLTVLGQDDSPKPVLFSFPSRHHRLTPSQASDQTYTMTFEQPAGLHPNLKITFSSATNLDSPTTAPEGSICALHAYFTLPSTIFADQYAFPTTTLDPLFEAAHHIRFLRSISGELDLEAPDYVIEKWGSTMLLELSTPSSSSSSQPPTSSVVSEWEITIPLHLRYLPPSKLNSSSHSTISIPYPNIFWACTAEPETQFSGNPFDRIHLGYDSLFGPETMFYHLQPQPQPQSQIHSSPASAKINPNSANTQYSNMNGTLMASIDVPVLNTAKVGGDDVVEWGTVIVVLAGFAWVVAKLWPGIMDLVDLLRRSVSDAGKGGGDDGNTKKKADGVGKETRKRR